MTHQHQQLNEGAIPHLRELLHDQDPNVVAEAATALGSLDDTESIPALRELLLHWDPTVVAGAIEALASLEDTESISALREMLQHDDPAITGSAALAIGELHDIESIPELRELLHHDAPVVRGVVALALGRLDDRESIPALRELLQHDNPGLHSLAALALGRLEDRESIPALRELLQHHHYPTLCAEAAGLLCDFGDMESLCAFRELLRHDDPVICRAAAIAVGQLRDPESIPALRELLWHGDAASSIAAALALAVLGNTQSIPALRELLHHHDSEICRQAAWVLGHLKELADRESTLALRECLEREDPKLVAEAVTALGSLDDTESIPALRKLLQHDDPTICGRAAWALGQLGDTESIPALRELLEHDHPFVRCTAVLALRDIRDTESIPVLGDLAEKDHSDDVRVVATCARGWLQPGRFKGAVARAMRQTRDAHLREMLQITYDAIRQPLPDREKDEFVRYLISHVLHPDPSKQERLVLCAYGYPFVQQVLDDPIGRILRPDGYESVGHVLVTISPTVVEDARLRTPFRVPLQTFDSRAHTGFLDSVQHALRRLSRGKWQWRRAKYHGRARNRKIVKLNSEITLPSHEGAADYLSATLVDLDLGSDPVLTTEREEALALLRALLRDAEQPYRHGLHLKFWDNLTWKQAADAVHVHERQLRRFLHTQLKPKVARYLELFRQVGLIRSK